MSNVTEYAPDCWSRCAGVLFILVLAVAEAAVLTAKSFDQIGGAGLFSELMSRRPSFVASFCHSYATSEYSRSDLARQRQSSGSQAQLIEAGTPKTLLATKLHYSGTSASVESVLWHQIIVYLRSWLLQPGFVGKVRWRSIVGGDKHSNRTIILPLWSMVTNSSAHSALATAHCFDFAGRRCRPSFFRRAVSDSRALTSPLQLLL